MYTDLASVHTIFCRTITFFYFKRFGQNIETGKILIEALIILMQMMSVLRWWCYKAQLAFRTISFVFCVHIQKNVHLIHLINVEKFIKNESNGNITTSTATTFNHRQIHDKILHLRV